MVWNQIKTVLLLGALAGLLIFVGGLLGGRTGLLVGLVFAILMNFGMYFFSHKLVLAMYGAKEAPKSQYPKLHHMIEEISKKAGIPKPKVYILPTEILNAFATGRNPKHAVVACTQGILKRLNDEELKGVLAHEISHVKNRDMLVTTIAATIASVISYLAQMAQFAAIFGGGRDENGRGNILGMLVIAILAPIIALVIQLAISRSREYLADESGAKTLKNPHGLASALKKLEASAHANPLRHGNQATASLFIVNPFSLRGLTSLFSTHPPTSARVEKLQKLKF